MNNFPDSWQPLVKRCPKVEETGHPAWVGEVDECPRCAGRHGPPKRGRGANPWIEGLGGVDPEMSLELDPIFEEVAKP